MRAGQTLKDDSGREIFLFPLEYMNISQGMGGDFSHQGTYAIDFLGWNVNGRQLRCPYYAPFSCTCTYVGQSEAEFGQSAWTSDSPVVLPDGTIGIATICFNHDNTPPTLGTHVNQGEVIGHTGTAGNVTGDHVHIEVVKGGFQGLAQNDYGVWYYVGSFPPPDGMYVNDTVLVNDYHYNWKIYGGGTPGEPAYPILPPEENFIPISLLLNEVYFD